MSDLQIESSGSNVQKMFISKFHNERMGSKTKIYIKINPIGILPNKIEPNYFHISCPMFIIHTYNVHNH